MVIIMLQGLSRKNNHYIYHNVTTVMQENDHYVYLNAATVVIPKWVSDINSYQRMFIRQKRVHKVCESTGGSILAHVNRV